MSKYTISLTVTYELKGKILKEYLEWLDDYRDTEKMRKAFLTDRFISPNWREIVTAQVGLMDVKKTKLTIEKEKGNE
jgi:hypothetical protein